MSTESSARKIEKTKATVSVKLNDGEMFDGHFFVSGDERVTDLLNGEKQYLPFEALNGFIYVINKASITRVIAKERRSAEESGLIPPRESRW